MVSVSQEVTREAWSSEAASGLAIASGGDREFIAKEVRAGISKLWRLGADAWLVTREEESELVVVCFEGKNLRQWAAWITDTAKRNGFASMRFHTERRGLARLTGLPFDAVETVYKMRLGNGQQIEQFQDYTKHIRY